MSRVGASKILVAFIAVPVPVKARVVRHDGPDRMTLGSRWNELSLLS